VSSPERTPGPSSAGATARRTGGAKLRCAIVGLGRIGSSLEDDRFREKPASHAGAIAANRHCVLAAACDRRQDSRLAFARRWRCRRLYADLRVMLAAERPDILHIATPADTHRELIAEAASRAVPLVICEKPLCPTAEAARAVLASCRAAGTTLMVNHERRYSLDYALVRTRVREQHYGQLLSVQGRLYMGRGRRPSDILLEDGTHMVDAIRYISGEDLEPWHAVALPEGEPSGLQVLFRCGAARGFLEVSGDFEALVFELELGFQRGRLRVGNGVYEEWESAPSRFYEGFHSLRRVSAPRFRRTRYFAGMMEDAVAVALHPGRIPQSSGQEGLRALETIESILSCAL
jgi:predicted dehydrogenase